MIERERVISIVVFRKLQRAVLEKRILTLKRKIDKIITMSSGKKRKSRWDLRFF